MNERRELSIHQAHELLLKLEEGGLDTDLAQKVIQSKNSRLAKEIIALIRDHKIPNSLEARTIMGQDYFFGWVEWLRYTGHQIDGFPVIPWTEKELISLHGRHFLFQGIENLNGKPLTPLRWEVELAKMGIKLHIEFNGTKDLSRQNQFLSETCKSRWYLMPLDVFPETRNKYYSDQTKLLAKMNYEPTSLIERLTGNILYYVLCKKFLDINAWATTSSRWGPVGEQLVIRFDGKDLCIGTDSVNITTDPNMGIAASLKLPA
jgi:hypothetical protein